MIIVREEKQDDIEIIRAINLKAFGQSLEGEIVDKLRDKCNPFVSLVAESGNDVVGHILFTPVFIKVLGKSVEGMGLAPMAVLPEFQKKGVGAALVKEGLERVKQTQCSFVIVLGHPEYYPLSGFKPVGKIGFEAPYPIPEKDSDAWMIQTLKSDVIGTYSGKIICANKLNKPKYWQE